MDYAEIIEPLERCDYHRVDAERSKIDVAMKVAKVERAGRVEKLERTEATTRHERADKTERSERSGAKGEKKRASAKATATAAAASASAAPVTTERVTSMDSGGLRAAESIPAHTAATVVSAPPPVVAPPQEMTLTPEESVMLLHAVSAEELSPSERPLVQRLTALPESQEHSERGLSSTLAPSAAAAREGASSDESEAETDGDDGGGGGGGSGSVRSRDADIKDCYIVIKPIDLAQYLNKSRVVEDASDGGEAGEAEWDTHMSPHLPPPLPPPPAPTAPAPADPTQEIESQLALLEEMSSHLAAHRGAEAEDASIAGASVSPAALHDEASVSTLASEGVASAPSDAEPPAPPPGPKRARVDERLAGSSSTNAVAGPAPEDCDKDSVSSSDVAQEGCDSPNKALKRKPRKRKRKNEPSEHIVFEAHRGPILDVKTVGRHVLAACEDGSVYCYSLKSGKLKRQYSGHTAAVICLAILEREGPEGEDPVPEYLYTGSLDHQLRCFQFKTGELVNHPVNLGKPIQCMDENWGTIFMGTKMGEIAKFYTKSFKLNEDYLRCSKDSILAIKATKEGARKIVIVAARNEPVTIRDANSGLLMRVVGHNLPHTVYSLLLDSSLLYCGTKTGKIPVFSFTTGEEICKYSAGYGVVCMRVYNHLLFAGCYDGNIYIYSTQDKSLISCIPGPGKMLLCLDVVKNRIIAGSKDNKLEAWPLPADVKNCIRESRHR